MCESHEVNDDDDDDDNDDDVDNTKPNQQHWHLYQCKRER